MSIDAVFENARMLVQRAASGSVSSAIMAQSPGSEVAGDTGSLYALFRGYNFSVKNVIGNRIAARPIHVCEVLPPGQKSKYQIPVSNKNRLPQNVKGLFDQARLNPIDNHLIARLLDNPNPFMIRSHLISTTIYQYLIEGRCYWLLDYDVDKSQWIIWPIPGFWVRPPQRKKLDNNVNVDDEWDVLLPWTGRNIKVERKYLVPFYYPDPANPTASISPTAATRRSAQADLLAETTIEQGLRNSSNPAWAFIVGSTPELKAAGVDQMTLTADQRKQFGLYLDREFRGSMRASRPVVLDGLIKDAKRLSLTPPEMGGWDMMRSTADRVSELENVSPISMGRVESTSYAASANTDMHLCMNRLNPISTMLSETLTCYLPVVLAPNSRNKIVIFQEETSIHDPELEHLKQIDWTDRGAYGVNEARQDNGWGNPLPNDYAFVSVGGTAVTVGKKPPPMTEFPAGDGGSDSGGSKSLGRVGDRYHEIRNAGIAAASVAILGMFPEKYYLEIQSILSGSGTPEELAYKASQFIQKTEFANVIQPVIKQYAMSGAAFEMGIAGKKVVSGNSLTNALYQSIAVIVADTVGRLVNGILGSIKSGFESIAKTYQESPSNETIPTRDVIENSIQNIARRASGMEIGAAIGGGQNAVRTALAEKSLVGIMWCTCEDIRVRPAHRKANTQTIKPGRMFYVGGEYCRYPHDPTLSPENRSGCRCWTQGVYR